MSKKKGFHLTATGMVQGVGYRYYCMEAGRLYGLCGYVMNMPDGSVELEVEGDGDAINKFINEITRKDRTFSVSGFVKEETAADKGYTDFTIKHY
jgi:acylphosphatase